MTWHVAVFGQVCGLAQIACPPPSPLRRLLRNMAYWAVITIQLLRNAYKLGNIKHGSS